MISAWLQDAESAAYDLTYVANYLTKAGLAESRNLKAQVQNIVASLDLEAPIDLSMVTKAADHIIYEPEQFLGAIYRPSCLGRMSILLFASGKVVIAGARTDTGIRVALEEIVRLTRPRS